MSDPGKAPNNFEQAFLNEYPNPDRIGCPGNAILKGLASRRLPISHPARMHIGQCSPCWREFRAFEANLKKRRNWTIVGGIAALLFILALGPYLYWFSRQRQSEPTIALDFRSINPTRGPGQQQRSKIHLPASAVRLVITLPWGSSEGIYEAELRSSTSLVVVAKARGTAKITDGDTSLTINRIDLTKTPHGNYSFSLGSRDVRFTADVTVP